MVEERVTKKNAGRGEQSGRSESPAEEKPDRVLTLAREIFVQVVAQPYHSGLTTEAMADKCIEYSKAFWTVWDAAERSNG